MLMVDMMAADWSASSQQGSLVANVYSCCFVLLFSTEHKTADVILLLIWCMVDTLVQSPIRRLYLAIQADALQAAGHIPDHVIILEAPEPILTDRARYRRIDPDTHRIYHVPSGPGALSSAITPSLPDGSPDAAVAARLAPRGDDSGPNVQRRLTVWSKHARLGTAKHPLTHSITQALSHWLVCSFISACICAVMKHASSTNAIIHKLVVGLHTIPPPPPHSMLADLRDTLQTGCFAAHS